MPNTDSKKHRVVALMAVTASGFDDFRQWLSRLQFGKPTMKNTVARRDLLDELFASIDAMDTASFLTKLTPNAEFRFATEPPVRNRISIGEAVNAFYSTIAGLHHELTNTIADDRTVACEGIVTYTRHDKTTVTLPFVNIFEFDDDLIDAYRIYIDIGPLYATTT